MPGHSDPNLETHERLGNAALARFVASSSPGKVQRQEDGARGLTDKARQDEVVDAALQSVGILPAPQPLLVSSGGAQPVVATPSEPDAISGADELAFDHPLADYYVLYAALSGETFFALEAAARRRERIRATGRDEPPAGSDLVQVPLPDLLDPALMNWQSHAEIVDEVFEGMVEHPDTAEDGARRIAENDARRLFLEPRVNFGVDIEVDDPDAQMNTPTRLRFRVGALEIEDRYGEIPLQSLEPLGPGSLSATVEQASRLAAQVAEAAVLLASVDGAIATTQEAAADIRDAPEDVAFNKVIALQKAAGEYLVYFWKFAGDLDPANDFLRSWMEGAAARFRPARFATVDALTIADNFRRDTWPGPTGGETYSAKEKEMAEEFHDSGAGGKVLYGAGWLSTKGLHLLGEAGTLGG